MVEYRLNSASEAEIAEHLRRCDASFVPPLSERVAIEAYAKKIASTATRFEAWSGGTLVALVASYCNDRKNWISYITSVSVLGDRQGTGIAGRLMRQCIEHARALGMREVRLEVARDSLLATKLYERHGFVAAKGSLRFCNMTLCLSGAEDHDQRA